MMEGGQWVLGKEPPKSTQQTASVCISSSKQPILGDHILLGTGQASAKRLCHGTDGKHPAHVCRQARNLEAPVQPPDRDIPGEVMGFPAPAAPSPRATHKPCQSLRPCGRSCCLPRLPAWILLLSILPPAALFACSMRWRWL